MQIFCVVLQFRRYYYEFVGIGGAIFALAYSAFKFKTRGDQKLRLDKIPDNSIFF